MHGTRFDPTPQMEQVRNPNGPRIQRDDHRVMCDTCLPSAAAFAAKDISILLLIIPSSLSFLYLGLLPVIFIFLFFCRSVLPKEHTQRRCHTISGTGVNFFGQYQEE